MEYSLILDTLLSGQDLSEEIAGEAISSVMSGEWTPIQISALLTAFRSKGETIDEIVGAARAMIQHAETITSNAIDIMDTCGTGGDRSGSFNISTTTALIVAGCGIPVAKHGNRSATSQCGSIDLLEKMGVNVMMAPEQIGRCLDEVGMTVLFARVVHPAMRFAAPVRSELGFRTIFNYLGPLTNPIRPHHQLVGVSDARFLKTYAACLQRLGIQKAWVLSASDGMDEITLAGPTSIYEVTPTRIEQKDINPADLGLQNTQMGVLRGGTPDDNVRITKDLLSGKEKGPRRDAVLLNAAAALNVAGKCDSLEHGIQTAADSIDSGKAEAVLEHLIRYSNNG